MNPTLCKEIYEGFLQYLSAGLSAYLIYNPALGLAEPRDAAEYLRRYNLTMQEAVGYEILMKGGYSRYPFKVTPIYRESIGYIILEPEWQASEEPLGPFTHVCIAHGTNTYNASPANGNNRGDYQGKLIAVYPCGSPSPQGLILTPPIKYRCRVPIKLIGREL